MTEIWSVDAEWGYSVGHINDHGDFVPRISSWRGVVFCAVGLHSGDRLHFWGKDPRLFGFIHDHEKDLFVSHYVPAEMTFLLRMNISLPPRWFCTYTAWRRLSNSSERIGASLLTMLQELGYTHRAPQFKQELQQKILRLDFDQDDPNVRNEIINYCFDDCDDCDDCAIGYKEIVGQISTVAMNYWCEYHKSISRMELRGVPCDYRTASLILRSRWVIADHLIDQINKTWPVYRDRTFSSKSFLAWCTEHGIRWPFRNSDTNKRPYRSFSDDAMTSMEYLDPFIATVRQVRKTLNAYKRKSSININERTSRQSFNTSPFRSLTSRNQPHHFILNQPK